MMKKSVALLLLLSACGAQYPLQMSEAQWHSLSPVQQQQAYAQQQQQDALARQQYEAQMRMQQEMQLQAERDRLEFGARQRLGITQGEWMSMTPDMRLNLRQQQEAIEREGRAQQDAARGSSEMAAATRDIAGAINEKSRQELYTNSAYGSVVDCDVTGGHAKFSVGVFDSKWADIAPLRFSVAKGDDVTVEVRRQDRQKQTTAFWVGFKPSQELEFCANENSGRRYKSCRTHAVTDAFRQGYSADFEIPSTIEGARLSCRFAPGRS